MGGVGRCAADEEDVEGSCEEELDDGTGPIMIGMQTEGGRDEIKEAD